MQNKFTSNTTFECGRDWSHNIIQYVGANIHFEEGGKLFSSLTRLIGLTFNSVFYESFEICVVYIHAKLNNLPFQ